MLKIKSNKFIQELMGIIFKYVEKKLFSVVDGFIARIGRLGIKF